MIPCLFREVLEDKTILYRLYCYKCDITECPDKEAQIKFDGEEYASEKRKEQEGDLL